VFRDQVVAMHLPRNAVMTLKHLFDIVRSLSAWLDIDSRHVAIVHCGNGFHRTGLAIAGYLRYADMFDSMHEVRFVSFYASYSQGV
jgi:hypothetical protein